MKKLLAIILSVFLVFGATACGAGNGDGGNGPEKRNEDQTTLYVSHFAGGFGSEWIKSMKAKFEEAYKDVSFEEGKTGVQVMIDDHKNLASRLDIAADDSYVFFNEDVPYKELVDTNKIMDITDVVTGTFDINSVAGYETVPDVEEKAVINRFTDLQKEALNLGTASNAAYYAIPHYEGYYGFTYDADLFDSLGYYMFEDGEFGAHADSNGLSVGPDGVAGTYDDGLPKTYEDFFAFCKFVNDDGNVPMIFSGEYQFYIMNAINALITDYNGYDNERLYYTFNGETDSYVTGFNGNTPVLGNKTITDQNGYDVFRQASYYYGFSFLYDLIHGANGEYLYSSCFTDGFSHTSAQNAYLLSAKNSQPDIALLADGTWWQNEAAGTFSQMEGVFPNSGRMQRNLKFMPLPKATDDKVGSGLTLLESQKSYIMLRKNMPEKYIPLAKLFVQFCNQVENIREFTVLSNTPKALQYDMPTAELNKLTPFGKSLWEMKSDENTKIVYQLSSNPLYASNMTKFKKHESLAYGSYAYASKAMDDNASITARSYFEGLANSWQSRWADDFKDFLK